MQYIFKLNLLKHIKVYISKYYSFVIILVETIFIIKSYSSKCLEFEPNNAYSRSFYIHEIFKSEVELLKIKLIVIF